MKLNPLNNNLVIKVLPKENVTESGIILPGKKDDSDIAIVCEVGPNVNQVKNGDKIIFNNGKEVKIENEKYIIIQQEGVLAIVE